MIHIKTASEVQKMRRAGLVVAKAHQAVAQAIKSGITTKELDDIAREVILKEGAIPSFKDYHGYPANICTSVNEQVIHGIPSGRKLLEGDIVSVDIGAVKEGFHGDAAATYGVGKISTQAKKLIETAELAFYQGIQNAREGMRLSDISAAIQSLVEGRGYSIVKDFVGHGIGKEMHEEPEVPNYVANRHGIRLYAGMALAIEPMINIGNEFVKVLGDGWTVVTLDGSLSAHYEHTIVITKDEPMIMTKLD